MIIDLFLWELRIPSRRREPIQYPETNWPKLVDAEIRLRELGLREKELEVRRLEALAKLKDTGSDAKEGASDE